MPEMMNTVDHLKNRSICCYQLYCQDDTMKEEMVTEVHLDHHIEPGMRSELTETEASTEGPAEETAQPWPAF
jgi:hypothetical protein